jgi:pimeloyl-ACP methyl ester carboxylesterase
VITVSPKAGVVHSARVNAAFSANGRWGVCLKVKDEDLALEHWTLTSEEAVCWTIPNVAVDRRTHPLPLDDGRILLLRSEGTSTSGRHTLTLLQLGGRGILRQRLADIPGLGCYLVPSPGSGQLGFIVTLDNPKHSTIWRLSSSPPHIEPILRIPGSLSGGMWADGDRSILAVNQSCDSYRSSGIVVDLPHRSWRRIWSVSDEGIDRILLVSPRSKLLVVTTNSAGEERLGWGILGDSTIRFPETLHRAGYVRQALTLDDPGERLLVREVAGAVSRLLVYRPADDVLTPVAGPPGTFSAPASWAGEFIRLRFSAPDQPPTLATVRLGTARLETRPRWFVSRDGQHESQPVWAQAELIELQGPAGPIEAIIYGGPDWRRCQHLVVALHGGPLSSWRFEFDPLFQCLAQAGVAVVAPNYRGSTGYGDEHLRAVVGNWGGPDLQDVLQLGESLDSERGRRQLLKPVVLGASYGAFLALLAASHKPQLWSACVALAPFLSGPSLYRCADIAVRNRIEQLGGLKRIDDALGSRDVLRVCKSLSAPLLLIHGSKDETIPVEQSRLLRLRLSELGRIEGVDFEYLEADSGHEEVALAWPKVLRHKVMSFCLARPD